LALELNSSKVLKQT